MAKTFMAIGGHVGDMELTAGCVLAHQAVHQNKIITVALTAGERGNPKNMSQEDYRVQKVKEAQEFAEMLNGEAMFLDYRDGELPDNEEVRWPSSSFNQKISP